MGNAVCQVHNRTHKKLCVLTFNQADLLYQKYEHMYSLDPGASCVVEALSNPIGLKVGIVFDAVPDADQKKGGQLKYQRWAVKKEKVLTITALEREEITAVGEDFTNEGKSTVNCRKVEDFATAVECLTYVKPAVRDARRAL